jgi:hypothetical protein
MLFSITSTQLLELQIPAFLKRLRFALALGIKIETNFVEPRFSVLIHCASFEDGTLIDDPTAQLWVFLAPLWRIACNAGRETVEC